MQPNELKICAFFKDFSSDELEKLVSTLAPVERNYRKGEIIIHAGDTNDYIRFLLSGSACAVKTGVGGDAVYTALSVGDTFGGIIAASYGARSAVTVSAAEDVRAVCFDFKKLKDPQLPEPGLRLKMLAAAAESMAGKYFALQDRVDCITRPTLREKIMTYLLLKAERSGSRTVCLRQTRDRTAAYLNADRTALSRELSAMQADGIIEYEKNTFKIL